MSLWEAICVGAVIFLLSVRFSYEIVKISNLLHDIEKRINIFVIRQGSIEDTLNATERMVAEIRDHQSGIKKPPTKEKMLDEWGKTSDKINKFLFR